MSRILTVHAGHMGLISSHHLYSEVSNPPYLLVSRLVSQLKEGETRKRATTERAIFDQSLLVSHPVDERSFFILVAPPPPIDGDSINYGTYRECHRAYGVARTRVDRPDVPSPRRKASMGSFRLREATQVVISGQSCLLK